MVRIKTIKKYASVFALFKNKCLISNMKIYTDSEDIWNWENTCSQIQYHSIFENVHLTLCF